jgi:hypothetical protein
VNTPTLPPVAADYLARQHVMTLATFGAAGPWAAAVFYVHAGPEIYFVSSPRSRHVGDLTRDPRCAATVQANCTEWAQIKGIQMAGRAFEIRGEEEAHALRLYGEKFPLVGALGSAPAAIVAALARVRWYRLRVECLYFIDNSRGLGQRERYDLMGA